MSESQPSMKDASFHIRGVIICASLSISLTYPHSFLDIHWLFFTLPIIFFTRKVLWQSGLSTCRLKHMCGLSHKYSLHPWRNLLFGKLARSQRIAFASSVNKSIIEDERDSKVRSCFSSRCQTMASSSTLAASWGDISSMHSKGHSKSQEHCCHALGLKKCFCPEVHCWYKSNELRYHCPRARDWLYTSSLEEQDLGSAAK